MPTRKEVVETVLFQEVHPVPWIDFTRNKLQTPRPDGSEGIPETLTCLNSVMGFYRPERHLDDCVLERRWIAGRPPASEGPSLRVTSSLTRMIHAVQSLMISEARWPRSISTVSRAA